MNTVLTIILENLIKDLWDIKMLYAARNARHPVTVNMVLTIYLRKWKGQGVTLKGLLHE